MVVLPVTDQEVCVGEAGVVALFDGDGDVRLPDVDVECLECLPQSEFVHALPAVSLQCALNL